MDPKTRNLINEMLVGVFKWFSFHGKKSTVRGRVRRLCFVGDLHEVSFWGFLKFGIRCTETNIFHLMPLLKETWLIFDHAFINWHLPYIEGEPSPVLAWLETWRTVSLSGTTTSFCTDSHGLRLSFLDLWYSINVTPRWRSSCKNVNSVPIVERHSHYFIIASLSNVIFPPLTQINTTKQSK